ncbi:MAG: cell division protein FtsZ [Betaproteobacteria bacterium AqS2]|uniref:Cell division protein FtsZ n=1 Tax=Candidatus Amphirhobacter heronislandensis TaxID=1732024 RepID=A0A930UER9_9GAMM|nr:cell division protein FtsZ [Betaproteobacteria bacterium AqS2]
MNSNINFIEENKTRARIKVIGVGGGGGNAVNAMAAGSLDGALSMYAVNTDAQALDNIREGCERIQIGHKVAGGLGVGADYARAEEAARQDIDRIDEIIDGADMVFIAAGMGGGTGTGASHVIASRCQDRGILTVAVVTKPFSWENRGKNAEVGIDNLSRYADSIIIVPNDRVAEVYGDEINLRQMFVHSDTILSNAVSGICDIIYTPGHINVDFADVKAVMSETGQAMMGTAAEKGVDRANRAAHAVIECPLLEGIELANARGLLVNITADQDNFSMKEVTEMMEIIRGTSASGAQVFFGVCDNKELGDEIRITLVATGLRSSGRPSIISSGGGKGANGSGRSGASAGYSRKAHAAAPSIVSTNREGGAISQGSLLNGGRDEETPAMLRRQHS